MEHHMMDETCVLCDCRVLDSGKKGTVVRSDPQDSRHSGPGKGNTGRNPVNIPERTLPCLLRGVLRVLIVEHAHPSPSSSMPAGRLVTVVGCDTFSAVFCCQRPGCGISEDNDPKSGKRSVSQLMAITPPAFLDAAGGKPKQN